MNYLKNDICSFKPLFKLTKSKKNIVSSSLFKIHGGGYKNFEKYISGVKHLSRYVDKEMDNFTFRLFIDDSVYEDKEIMKQFKGLKVDIVVYSCPEFMINKNHIGLFGTLVRFFPMFNFPENDAKTVLISDVDYYTYESVLGGKQAHTYNLYLLMENRKEWNKIKYVADVKYYNRDISTNHIIADRQVSKGDLDHNLIIKFIKNIDKYKGRLSYYPPNRASLKNKSGKFIYGVDEWFINNVLVKDLVKRKIEYAFRIGNEIGGYIKIMIRIFNKNQKEISLFFSWVFPDEKKKSNRAFFKLLEERCRSDDYETIIRIYEYFISIYGTHKEKYFGSFFLKHILSREYIGIYNYSKIVFYNTNIPDYYLRKVSLPESDINYLKNLMGYN